MNEIELSAGTIRYRDTGQGPPIVFVHGLLVDGTLWRKVVPPLEGRFRCIVPDLPLGSHTIPAHPTADLTPPGLAKLIGELLDALDLNEATIVANDTGGALTQILMTTRSDRIGRVVLTPCDSFDNFFPPMFRPLQWLARVPGGVNAAIQPLRIPALRRLPVAFGWLAKRPIPVEVTTGWLRPCQTDARIRRDTRKVLRGVDPRHTNAAAERLPQFAKPVLITWAPEDRVFPIEHARKLAALLPNARIEEVPDSYTFVPEDQPQRLADLIAGFAAARAEEGVGTAR